MAGISKQTYNTKKGVVTKYVITYRDITGKQRMKGGYNTLKEAKADLSKFEELKICTAKNPTFGFLIDNFMDKAERKFAKNTFQAYKSYITKYLTPWLNVRYDKMNPLILQATFDKWEKEKPYTAHNILLFCRGAINYNIKKKVIAKYNVFEDLDDISRPPKETKHLEFEELITILNKCYEIFPRHFAMIFLLMGAGLRIGECVALEISDFFGDYVHINKQYTADQLEYHTKTSNSLRDAYLFNILTKVIRWHISNLSADSKLLFPNEAGGYINPSNFRNRIWKPLLKECGITKRVRLHDIRGSYIDLLLANGVSGKFAQENVGHGDWSVTYNEYSKNNRDGINNAMTILNNMFSNKLASKKCYKNVINFSENEQNNVVSLLDRMSKKGIKKES